MAKRARRILGALVALVLLALVGGYWYERPLLLTGTGYAAHNACAVRLVAGRDDPASDLPSNPLVPHLRESRDGDAVTGSLRGVLARQRAYYTEGYGCTLAGAAPKFPAPPAVSDAGNPFAKAAAPAAAPAVGAALGRAFGDDLDAAGRKRLGTRAVVVVHRGELVAERYAEGFGPQTPQLGWSMAKSVTNLLVGRAVHQGVAWTSDAGLRPEWTGAKATITVDQLMRMTSGLSWDETYELGTPITTMLYREPNMAAYAASLELAHEPGTYQQYSSGSTNILCAYLREKLSAGPELPVTQLFSELGLASATWEPDATGTPVCSSYLWATPRDWAALGQFALDGGHWHGTQLLPQDWMADSTRVQAVAESEEQGYAAGWWTNREADGSIIDRDLPADAYWMQGHDGQRVIIVPSADLVVVRMGFSPDAEAEELRITPLISDLVNDLG